MSSELGREGPILEQAAWLHDVGYSSLVRDIGFHAIDGAKYLRTSGYSERICGLVAHHSAAEIESRFFGCEVELRGFPDEESPVRDLLWYCDMTTGPDGSDLSFRSRMEEVRRRYGASNYVALALEETMPARSRAMARAEQWLIRVGLAGQV